LLEFSPSNIFENQIVVVKGQQYAKAREYVVNSLDAIASGDVPPENLVITKILRKPVNSYRSMFPHVSAAIQLIQKEKRLRELEVLERWPDPQS
jgi:DNA polymerase elongation subunit (family B)